ncbi:peptidase M24, structural domain-containing protein [Armillaria novae-zelandiae]|uniref:Methionine aminopeptidase n=1 Tax=Armillaria novae-zelandiae TaxID=153914 RepID=A0AA39PH07_9AGAR|nr:peptidase M24, structural domain-containing protein [Armillaria novae-zelandiae]
MSQPAILCQSTTCPNGNPPSKLECPTCNKLGIRGSYFCGQECFKAGCVLLCFVVRVLSIHRAPDGSYNPFPNYEYTGSMRPMYPLSAKRMVPDHIPRPEYADDGRPMTEVRAAGQPPRILSKEEQDKMRTVCRLAREVLDIAASHVKPGVTTDELDEIVHNACIERNAYPSPLNYRNFPKSVCTSINEVICHGIPDRRKLKNGDIINIGLFIDFIRYHGDLNETYAVGEIDDDTKKLIRTTRECLDEAIKLCKPGALFRDLGKAMQVPSGEPIARSNGCAVVRSYTGHGVNDLFHCSPNIPHYAKNKAVGTMKAGMVFTIEPMINLGHNWGDVHWPDNWTATTVDGKKSAQFEDTLLITETGVEVLTEGKKRDL